MDLERITPRPDSTASCRRCGGVMVYDEIHGWTHSQRGCLPWPFPGDGGGVEAGLGGPSARAHDAAPTG